ncbi:uncharacterized protein LOC106780288 [Vigna radiata var. radiata]|uniref:Uncharacterized protein LOC106780288 n=1 Tax=Vigna radiata var. radiata TaxID=3916 RepID=A0A1S3W0R2_VIGRR|nr:uncharacterized protein LOC106780288 [Vigna radiata var. radiata]
MRPQDVPEDQVILRIFPYSLEDAAREWMYCLAPRSITSWDDMKSLDRSMIDVAGGGALEATTPTEARNLIEKMASNSQQFGTKSDTIVVKGVHDIATQSSSSDDRKLESKLDSLVSLVSQMASNQRLASPSKFVARHCGICFSYEHYTYECPTLQ